MFSDKKKKSGGFFMYSARGGQPRKKSGTTGDKFLTYLKDILIPTLRPGDIVVIDNLRTHHIQAVGELLHNTGVDILYLPPYS